MSANLQHRIEDQSAAALFFRPRPTRRLIPIDSPTTEHSMNRILVTGASGTIGTPLVAGLRAVGADLLTLRSRGTPQAGERVASFEDVDALTRAFEGVDTLFLLFPLVENKRVLAANAARAARAAGVRHIVRSSGKGADPASAFTISRLQGEVDAILAETGVPTTFLRPGGFMQNWATFMASQVKAGTVYAAHGDGAQSLVDARDIAAVAAAVLQNPVPHAGRTYTITGGESLGTAAFAERVGAAIGRPVRYQPVSFEQANAAMADMGLSPWMVELMDSLNRVIAAGWAAAVSPDVQDLLGRAPIDASRFASDYAPAWR
jgi:uncharacterized protein YbjT (DUF2867 family)